MDVLIEVIHRLSTVDASPSASLLLSNCVHRRKHALCTSPDALVGTGFHSIYKALLAEMNERDENGLPKHSPFKIIEALEQLVWKTCMSVSEAYANTEPSKPESLQVHIQPPTLHSALAKDAQRRCLGH